MTSIERSLNILNHRDVDRFPFFDLLMNDAIIEYYSGEKLTVENSEATTLKAVNRLLDAVRGVGFPQEERTTEAADGTVITQQRWTSWHRPKLPLDQDAAVRLIKDTLKELKETAIDETALDKMIDNYFDLRARLPDTFLFGNFLQKTGIMSLYTRVGLEQFSYLMADNPELISNHMETETVRSVETISRLKRLEEIPAVFDCEDIASGRLLFSPDFLRKEFFPRLARIVDAYHQRGVKLIFHSDGNLMEILDDLAGCGIDGLNPLEVISGMDLAQIRKKYPDLILIGGIDCSQLLPFGTPDDVKKATKQAIRDASPWYFPGSSSELHNEIPLDNVKAMAETIASFTA